MLSHPDNEKKKLDEREMMLPDSLFTAHLSREEEEDEEVFRLIHEHLMSGHFRVKKTAELAKREGIRRPGLTSWIKRKIVECNSCQRAKVGEAIKRGPLKPTEVSNAP
jgi:hypothetical protein